mmetsp:Transcript_68833/g.199344  ORF Transcript_68833/g.199344 Transcript_68833/m.199344 type:complete len:217 (-) Transcript_68833:57-707(-)
MGYAPRATTKATPGQQGDARSPTGTGFRRSGVCWLRRFRRARAHPAAPSPCLHPSCRPAWRPAAKPHRRWWTPTASARPCATCLLMGHGCFGQLRTLRPWLRRGEGPWPRRCCGRRAGPPPGRPKKSATASPRGRAGGPTAWRVPARLRAHPHVPRHEHRDGTQASPPTPACQTRASSRRTSDPVTHAAASSRRGCRNPSSCRTPRRHRWPASRRP